MDYERFLNRSQLEAVFYNESPLLVLAGAGSGKTRVITYKIAYLIDKRGVNPSDIFAVTFTNKAADEMRERVQALLGENLRDADLHGEAPAVEASGIWIRTFHSSAARILRAIGEKCGLKKGFSIIDQQDQLSMVKRLMKELKLDPDACKPEKYAALIDRAEDTLLDPEEAYAAGFTSDPLFYELYRLYEERLEAENLVDFGGLISKLTKAMTRDETVLRYMKGRFRHILIDEFQDTNRAQYEFVKALALPEGRICVVGDDDQSIYGFRGARIENILSFPKDFGGTKIIKLEENYRSYQTILSASSHLIGHNSERLGKTLYTQKGEGEKIRFYRAHSDYDEAQSIAREIRNLADSRGYSYSDIAVFYRMNAQSRVFENVFSETGIPYTIVGGLRFYEREEIKDVLAYLRLALNPMDEISLRRIANKPPRGIGEKTLDALIGETVARGMPATELREAQGIAASKRLLLRAFTTMISELGDAARMYRPPEALKLLYDATGYPQWLSQENKEEKLKNLEELYNAVEEFSKKKPGLPIGEFVEEVSLRQSADEGAFGRGRVCLITLHNAKGLEFPAVFMAGMEEGIFPHYLSGERLSDLQEERRLCYVGMTRAMEKLYLSAARTRKLYGRSIERALSSFVLELPRELLIWGESRLTAGEGSLRSFSRSLSFVEDEEKKAPPAKDRASSMNESFIEIEVNSRVVHGKYGGGKVLSVTGEVAEILFDDGKKMKFLRRYTPLTKEL